MSRTAFQLDLYQEHCEEIAGLYELRHARLDAWDTNPGDLAELEARTEAHIDALVLGGDAALAVVAAQPVADDPAGLYTLLALACRAQAFALVEPTLTALASLCGDPDVTACDAEFACQVAADALCHHAPPEWDDRLAAALTQALPHAAPVLATFVGQRRLARGELLQALTRQPEVDPVPILWAMARVPGVDVRVLLEHLSHPRPDVARAAAIAALRRDPRGAFDAIGRRWPLPWTALPLAVSAGSGFARRILEAAADAPSSENSLALGLLGDPAGIEVLLTRLSAEDSAGAEAAALALFLISGAGLRGDRDSDSYSDNDDVAVPDISLIPSAGFDLSIDRGIWVRWLKDHSSLLANGVRHRFGAPVTAGADIHALATIAAPRALRRLLADELVIRHGIDCGYEVDSWATAQMRALVAAKVPTILPGAWTRHGRTASP